MAENKKCKYEVGKDLDGDVVITNEFGCSWYDGVGFDPNGEMCGECTNITKLNCPARKQKKQ